MKKKFKTIVSIAVIIMVFINSISGFNVFAATSDNPYKTMANIASDEVGYIETTNSDGTFISKYGEWYGMSGSPWCAMFVSWCAWKANISNLSIPKFSSCSVGRNWFKNKNLWRDSADYTPSTGDLIFLNDCTHVGIVEKCEDDIVYTIEGNAYDSTEGTYGVRKRFYAISSSKITGYGIPDKNLSSKINGVATKKSTAYMLPDSKSKTVWEVWENDELEILCKDGAYYLVMYPFLSTGKFVCAYVPEEAVSPLSNVQSSKDYYDINVDAVTVGETTVYHNPSESSLLSNSGEDKKVRATLNENTKCFVLFSKDDFYFIKTGDGITGFVKNNSIELKKTDSGLCGDVDNDSSVNITDATVLQKFLVLILKEDNIQYAVSDTNSDGKVNIKDATAIQKYIVGIISELPERTDEETSTTVSPTNPTDGVNISAIWLPDNIEIALDETIRVSYEISPSNATNDKLYWMSSDDSVVTVTDDGLITGKRIGSTKIFVVSSNGVKSSATINVVNKYVDIKQISIDKTAPEAVYSGTSIQLNASIVPTNATNRNIEWTSSNPDIASVDSNGLVTTKTAGTAVITATSATGNVKATSTIKVNQLVSYIANGNYCFKLKGTNSYLDHQGGNSNGTNVHLWSGDGNSNPKQKIKLERIDDNRYKLWSATSPELMLDVNRGGTSFNDPLKVGLNIDLWTNNDWQAQEWLFTKTYDGYYIIRLNMLQEGAIEASGKDNGSNIFYGSYNCENDMQKWKLVNTTEYTAPETTAWICNTQDIGNVNVRSGPGTNYSSIGGFNEGQQITVIGSTTDTWLKVRGSNRHNGETIQGYTHRDYIRFEQVIVRERTAWVYNTGNIGNVNVRQGPGTGYTSIGGFNEGQQITVIGELNGDWYNVKGSNRHNGNIIEGYTHKDYVTFDKPSEPTYENPSPNLYSNSYNKNLNPFAQANWLGQCTWYAWGRTNEVTGKKLPCRGDARTWYSVAKNNGYSVGATPKNNSIAVWSNGSYGHVAYVEKVDGNNVTITESNWNRVTYDNVYTIEKGIYYYSGYKTLTKAQMSSRCGTLVGYIYL